MGATAHKTEEVVAPRHAGHYAEPTILTRRDGATLDARLLRGAHLAVHGLDAVPLRTLWLVHRSSGQRSRHARASLDAERRPRHESKP